MAEKQTEERRVIDVAYRGILQQFKAYASQDGRTYVILPDGRRAYVTPRRDGTYMVERS